ncbi:MAG: penicillin-binding protein 1A [Gammaproteobacteria bacterium]|nr:penicillin-binding protein 1A [Gammaproteobacteria bacterium]MBQ0838419.1 penicillin-binding protein 1A [Gammaproteobacteria bacterium]
MKHLATLMLRLTYLLLIPALGGALVVTTSLYLYLSPKLPSVETLKTVKLQTPLRVYSQDMKLIGEFGEKRRTPISFDAIPPQFVNAVLSAEDDGFYSHIGVDFKGLARAALELVTTGHIQTGGSTITMQLARNFFLSREQSFIRKFNEILLALRIEDELEKDEILALYANKIYLGNRSYGVEAAAMTYYGKSISELSLAQMAMIAGLPKAPSRFNPIINPERALTRRNWILGRMYKLGHIDRTALETARSHTITAQYHGSLKDYDAPYVAEIARQTAVDLLGAEAYTSGYSVLTTIDSTLQSYADRALVNGLLSYDWRHGYRGPEANFANPEQWPVALQNTLPGQRLEPAIVTHVDASSIALQTRNNASITLSTENALQGLRSYISENKRSAPIKDLGTVFSIGDLIRINKAANGEWQLTQIPDAQAALVSLNPETGAIQAMSGGLNFYQSPFNRVTQAQRQPGSNFKPFIYSAALEKGMTPASIINDAPLTFNDENIETQWRPVNSGGKFYGPTRLRQALYLSRNLVSIRVLQSTGITYAINTASKFGFNPKQLPHDLSLALGSHAVTPLAIASGYATFANGGYKIEPYLIERIASSEGENAFQARHPVVCRDNCAAKSDIEDSPDDPSKPPPLAAAQPAHPSAERILEPRIAYLVDSMLKDVVKRGTATKARAMKRSDIAGKTGTTNGPRDAWFSGYNPDLVTTTWLGFDDNRKLGRREFGGSAALPIWMDYMSKALANRPQRYHPQPAGLVSVRIDPTTGLRISPSEKNGIFELFREENLPAYGDTSNPDQVFESDNSLPEDIF